MKYMTEDPSVNGKPHDPMRDPAAEPPRDVPRGSAPDTSPDELRNMSRDASRQASTGGEADGVPGSGDSDSIEAMLGRAIEPVLQRLGSIEQTQSEVVERLDIIEQHTPSVPAHDTQTAAPGAAATTTDAVASAVDAHATEATVTPATAAATKSTTKTNNGNGLTVKQLLAVLGAFAVIYAAGFGFVGYQIADLSRRIDTQGTEIRAEVRESEARINARIDMLADKVAALQVAVAEILVRLRVVEDRLAHADTRLARLEGALDLPPLPQPPPSASEE